MPSLPAPVLDVADRPATAPVGRRAALSSWVPRAVLGLASLAFLLSAWLDDDAFVTFRTIDNLLAGRGLTWNPVERVQAFTHPLWLFVEAAAVAVTGEVEVTCLGLAIVISIATVALLVFRVAPTRQAGCVLAGGLLVSKAYVDFATSGLEDPLTRLLLVVFVLAAAREGGGVFALALLAGLATLCRPDAILLFLPALATRLLSRRQPRELLATAAGFAPVAVWGLFALLYYGTPFPNTAYAKLGGGVSRAERGAHGLGYLLDSLLRDPITLGVIAVAIVLALRGRQGIDRGVVAGAALYLAYVVAIGGDYMSGRFLGLPFLTCAVALARAPWPTPSRRATSLVASAVVLALAVRSAEPFLRTEIGVFRTGDERRTHHPYTGLVHLLGAERWPEHSLRLRGERAAHDGTRVLVDGAIGMVGFYAGPTVHVVDMFALSDPLLARLPGERRRDGDLAWRPGHVPRPIPAGYLESLPAGPNRVEDPDLAAYLDELWWVTRGPLLDPGRLRAAVRFGLGGDDPRLGRYVERHRQRDVTAED